MNFDESKHPRDKDGKFANKQGFAFRAFTPPQNDDKMKMSLPHRTLYDKIKNINPEEWRLYYKFIDNDSDKGALFYDEIGYRWVRISTKESNKIIIDDNTGKTSNIVDIYEFNDNDTMNIVLETMLQEGYIK